MGEAVLFGRLITAVVTPFLVDGAVDLDRFERLVDEQFSQGADCVCVCGTTGESPTLTAPEKLSLFSSALKVARTRGDKVIANVGSNCTADSVALAREAAQLGPDGIMAVVPYYNKPSQRGILAHFTAIAQAVAPMPVMVYNIPGRCVVGIETATMLDLMRDCPNVRAMKEAAVRPEVDRALLAQAPDDFELFSGNDEMTLDLMEVGASGVVSTTSNVAPAQMARMVRLFAEGDEQAARALHGQLLPLMKGLFAAPNPTLVKEALDVLGKPVGGLRLPMVGATGQERAELVAFMRVSGVVA